MKSKLIVKNSKVLVNNLEIRWSIGVFEHEKKQEQRVRINIALNTSWNPEEINDDIKNVVSYSDIVDGIIALKSKGHINLVETLSKKIAQLCLKDPKVDSVIIKIEKLDIYDHTESVGIELEYLRKND
tara:strand:- start:72219 stop:72602 length:384 start_codon:yes stop_codon:yes gene_type:complete